MDGINVSGSKWQQCISNKSVLYGKKKAGLEEGRRSHFICRAVYKDDSAESRMGKHGMQLCQYGSDASLMGEGSPQARGLGMGFLEGQALSHKMIYTEGQVFVTEIDSFRWFPCSIFP